MERNRSGARRRGAWAGLVAMLYLAALLGTALLGTPTARAANDNGSLSILLPKPNGDVAEGPVGAYLSISGTGTPNDQYQLGYATKDTSCQGGFTPLPSPNTTQAGGDGALTATFAWPANANAVGTEYNLCAQDMTTAATPPIQASNRYRVDASSAPAISTQYADISTPTPGTGAIPTPKAGHFYVGNGIQITGTNFTPGGTQILVYLSFTDQITQNSLQSATPLHTAESAAIQSDANGAFTATVVAPNQTGTYYLVVVSNDRTAALLPSLQAEKKVVLSIQPTPTPTPTPTPSPTATPKGAPKGNSTTPPPSTTPGKYMPAVVALSGLSIILLLSGILLLASTVAGPRARARQQ
ncbi:MAG: hypothetical protein IVW57_03020 [Ktedonobacterales bacterium]|nr:hypothetical protein [Ktedonobacterales bacterium]